MWAWLVRAPDESARARMRNVDAGVVWGLYMAALVVASVSTLMAVTFSLTTLVEALTSHIDDQP